MRASQTEPGQNARKSRSDGRDSELRPAETAQGGAEPGDTGNGGAEPLPANRAGSYIRDGVAPSSWQDIKSRFVDDPAGAVAAAEELVRRTVEDKVRALERKPRRSASGNATRTNRRPRPCARG